MRRAYVVAYLTFVELVRQPLYGLLLVGTGLMIALSPAFAMFTMLNNVPLVKDTGLATMLLAGLFLVTFGASSAVSDEIEKRTAATIISKPVSREAFLVGKFLGILAAAALAFYGAGLLLLLTVRFGVPEAAYTRLDYPPLIVEVVAVTTAVIIGALANFFFGKHFIATSIYATVIALTIGVLVLSVSDGAREFGRFGGEFDGSIVTAVSAGFLSLIILAAVAVAVATRARMLVTLIASTSVFLLGLMSRHLFGQFADSNVAARIVYAVLPDLQVFWSGARTWSHVLSAAGYAAVYATAALLIGVALFRNREMV